MSQIVVNVPGCDGVEATEANEVITIDTSGCAPYIEGPPPLVPWYGIVLGAIVALAFIVAIAIVRVRAHDRREEEHQADLNAQVEMAKAHKICDSCGYRYEPKVKK